MQPATPVKPSEPTPIVNTPILAWYACFLVLAIARIQLGGAPCLQLSGNDWGRQALIGNLDNPFLPTVALLAVNVFCRIFGGEPGLLLCSVSQAIIMAFILRLTFSRGKWYLAFVSIILATAVPFLRNLLYTLDPNWFSAVPAIMGARALDSEKDRMTSILVTPFLTCGAKLPIMALFAAMFFPDNAANVVFAMYILGVIMAIIAAKLLGGTVFQEKGSTFLLELPPYRIPDMKTVLLETWDKGKGYLIKAGTIIFAMSVLIWFLGNFNFNGMTEEMNESFLAALGTGMSKLFIFHGFDTWEAGAAVITGILAKESVVSTMGILYGVGEISAEAEDAVETAATLMQSGMATAFTTMSAVAFMVFSQLYTPCVTALGTIKKETGSWKWMGFSAAYMFAIAWVVSLLVYQGGRLMGF